MDKGNLYVIAAPSGTGKTSLVKALINDLSALTVSISHTTRAKRANEANGINYYFIDKVTFLQMVENNDFLEHAIIFDQHYGTSKNYVNAELAQGLDIILEIDWQGHQQVKRLFLDAISIFILPPSLEDLRKRLVTRNQDHSNIIQKRLADAQITISHIQEFDYIVINDDFDQALTDLKAIIQAGRLQAKRQIAKFASIIESFSAMRE